MECGAAVAQVTVNHLVAGSNPAIPAKFSGCAIAEKLAHVSETQNQPLIQTNNEGCLRRLVNFIGFSCVIAVNAGSIKCFVITLIQDSTVTE